MILNNNKANEESRGTANSLGLWSGFELWLELWFKFLGLWF